MNKFLVKSITEAGECPFYIPTQRGKKRCFFKALTTVDTAMALVEETDYDPDSWDKDCKGQPTCCSFIPLLYSADVNPPEFVAPENMHIVGDDEIADYDAFAKSAPVARGATPSRKQPRPKKPPVVAAAVEPEEPSGPEVQIGLVSNVYDVECDVFIYPTNQLLYIEDAELNARTSNNVQRECEKIADSGEVHVGSIYVTTGGGPAVKAKQIYHAVVATPTRLVNSEFIRQCMCQALYLADKAGAKTMAMLPADCGGHDIYQTAAAQLISIKDYLSQQQLVSLQQILIVMQDEQSYEAFEKSFNRIF